MLMNVILLFSKKMKRKLFLSLIYSIRWSLQLTQRSRIQYPLLIYSLLQLTVYALKRWIQVNSTDLLLSSRFYRLTSTVTSTEVSFPGDLSYRSGSAVLSTGHMRIDESTRRKLRYYLIWGVSLEFSCRVDSRWLSDCSEGDEESKLWSRARRRCEGLAFRNLSLDGGGNRFCSRCFCSDFASELSRLWRRSTVGSKCSRFSLLR